MRTLPLRDIAKFLLLFGFWIILSERMQLRYLAIGAVASLAVTVITRNIGLRRAYHRTHRKSEVAWVPFIFRYIPWLIWQVVLANIQVASMVIQRDLTLEPVVMELPLNLKRGTAQVVYANSITLTPGTVTVDVKDDTVIVHALSADSGDSLLSHEVHNRVAPLFFEQTLDNGTKAKVRDSFARRWVEGETP